MRGLPLSPPEMHAPDGFFTVWLALLGWIVMAAMVALAIRNTKTQLGERQVPLMAILAATIFAGQMLNFTIPGGTSGHLLGGALAAVIMGPWAAVLIMTSVISIQALVFQDGGLLALGLNVFNMGIVTAFTGYFVNRWIRNWIKGNRSVAVAGFVAGWVSVVLTSVFASLELAVSGASPIQVALPAMVGVHVMIGVGEGLLTAFALGFIMATRRDLITGDEAPGQRSASWVLAGVVLALVLTLLSPFASPYADGLERVAQILGVPANVDVKPVGITVPETPQFTGQAKSPLYKILPGYTIPFIQNTSLSTIVAGMIGVLVVFVLAYGVALIARHYSKGGPPAGGEAPPARP
jgi:cobalt/nickel transport system permease protein